MKFKKLMTTSLVVAITSAMMFTGCGGSKSEEKTADGKTKVRFASWDTAEDVDRQQKIVDQFNAAHDDIEVVLEAYGGEFDTKISAGMGSGDAPDVMYMWDYPSYYKGLEPLDSYIEKEGADYKDNFYDTLWAYNSLNGTTYGIPVGFTTHCLFYNKDIFAKAGVAEPTSDWTWSDVQKAAKEIASKLDGVKGFSFQMKPDPYDFEMYLWSNGSAYLDKDGKKEGALNSKESVEVLNLFQTMEKEGYAIATEKSGTDDFRSGQVAMYVYGSWAISRLQEDGLNYGVTTIPAFEGKGKSKSILSSSGVAISKDSKNKEAAWEFVKYWTSEEMNKERIGLELPVLHSVVEAEGIMKQPEFAPFYTMLEQSEGTTPASFLTENWAELRDTLSLSFEQVFNPSAMDDPKAVLDEAAME